MVGTVDSIRFYNSVSIFVVKLRITDEVSVPEMRI